MNIVSPVGRMLDPIADKLLVATCLLALAAGRSDACSNYPALIVLMREILVSGLREHLASIKIVVPVSQAAKWKTAIQMTALAMLIGAPILSGTGKMMAEAIGLILYGLLQPLRCKPGWCIFGLDSNICDYDVA